MISLKHLSNEDVLKNLFTLNNDEVNTVANILVHLIEANSRKLYAERGYSSIYAYCKEALLWCEGTTWRRVTAAKCIEQYPELLSLFKQQKLSLIAIALVSKILTDKNFNRIVEDICGKSKADVEKYVAGYLPEKNIREAIKPLPSLVKSACEEDLFTTFEKTENEPPDSFKTTFNLPAEVKDELNADLQSRAIEAEKEINFEIRLRAKASAVEKLKRVQELRGRNESLGDLLETLLDVYLDKNSPEARFERREKRAQSKSQTAFKNTEIVNEQSGGEKSNPLIVTRNISRKIRDAVYLRDGGRCAFVAEDGRRCTCRKQLQIDHIKPFRMGGSNEAKNLRLLCPEHNRLAAEMAFGRKKMKYFHRVTQIASGS